MGEVLRLALVGEPGGEGDEPGVAVVRGRRAVACEQILEERLDVLAPEFATSDGIPRSARKSASCSGA
jgi:hypothetical protein